MTAFLPVEHNVVLKQGLFDPAGGDQLTPIFDAYARYAATTENPILLIHFHGGLVPKDVAEAGAVSLYDGCYSGSCFPAFFIWETGFMDVIKNNVPAIFEETIFKQLVALVSKYALAKIKQTDATRGGVLIPESKFFVDGELNKLHADDINPDTPERYPFGTVPVDPTTITPVDSNEADQIRQEVEQDLVIQSEASKIANGALSPEEVEVQKASRGPAVQGSTETLMSPSIIDSARPDASTDGARGLFSSGLTLRIASGAVEVVARVVKRFIDRRDHGIQTTIVEEILREFYLDNVGKFVWSSIKDYSSAAFGASDQCGGTAFLNKLKGLSDQGKLPNRIVLVGHSAGSVYICHFLQSASKVLPNVKFEIIFLAAAVDFELMASTVTDCAGSISKIRTFSMSDKNEHGEFLLDLPETDPVPFVKHLYAGSLLYFLSGVCEGDDNGDKPLVGMQRYYTGQPPYTIPELGVVSQFVKAPPIKTVWSLTAADALAGYQCGALHHGGFPDDPETRASIKAILTTDFS